MIIFVNIMTVLISCLIWQFVGESEQLYFLAGMIWCAILGFLILKD